MRDVIAIMALFFLSVVFHLAWCRLVRHKELRMPSFCVVVFLVLGVYLLTTRTTASVLNVWAIPLKLTGTVFYLLLIPVYLIFCFGVSVESPSKRILFLLTQHKTLSYEDFRKEISDETVVIPRLGELVSYGFAVREREEYRLTGRGAVVAKVLRFYQALSGRGLGG